MTVSIQQTVATLRARAAKARMAREAQAATMRSRFTAAAGAQLPSHATAWLIGSLAWGGFGDHSDIDLVIRGVSPSEATSLELVLMRAVAWPVDVLRFEDLPPAFGARVLQEGIPLHGS